MESGPWALEQARGVVEDGRQRSRHVSGVGDGWRSRGLAAAVVMGSGRSRGRAAALGCLRLLCDWGKVCFFLIGKNDCPFRTVLALMMGGL
jgi:hypothetical protein